MWKSSCEKWAVTGGLWVRERKLVCSLFFWTRGFLIQGQAPPGGGLRGSPMESTSIPRDSAGPKLFMLAQPLQPRTPFLWGLEKGWATPAASWLLLPQGPWPPWYRRRSRYPCSRIPELPLKVQGISSQWKGEFLLGLKVWLIKGMFSFLVLGGWCWPIRPSSYNAGNAWEAPGQILFPPNFFVCLSSFIFVYKKKHIKVETTQMSINRWLDKQNVVYIYYDGILFTFKKEIPTHVTTWMNSEDILLSEISQYPKEKYSMVPHIWGNQVWVPYSYEVCRFLETKK